MPNAHTRTSNIELTEVERAELVSMARSRSLPAALALRARIVTYCVQNRPSRTAAFAFDAPGFGIVGLVGKSFLFP